MLIRGLQCGRRCYSWSRNVVVGGSERTVRHYIIHIEREEGRELVEGLGAVR